MYTLPRVYSIILNKGKILEDLADNYISLITLDQYFIGLCFKYPNE